MVSRHPQRCFLCGEVVLRLGGLGLHSPGGLPLVVIQAIARWRVAGCFFRAKQ